MPPPRRPRRWGAAAFVVMILAVGLLALAGTWHFDAAETHRIVIAVVVGGPLIIVLGYRLRGQWSRGLAFVGLWLAIALLAGIFWVTRNDLRNIGSRLMLAIMPGGAEWVAGVVKIPADGSGHYVVEGRVNGKPVRFIVDTGASGVVLGARDAERAGFQLSSLNYSREAVTAGGRVAVAPVRLGEIEVGSIRFNDFGAMVNPKMSDVLLLGMSFLNRLSGFEVQDGALILRQ